MIQDDSPDFVIDEELLRVAACPICPDRPGLQLIGHSLVCTKCQNAFPVSDGIPQLTPEDAVPLDQIKSQIDD